MSFSTSVIIPTLNKQEYLKKTINSILENTILPDEILIIEQGNINETNNIIKDIIKSKKYYNIKAIKQEIKSASIARNVGVKKSKGNILLFLDDDILIDKNYIKTAINIFKSNDKLKGLAPQDINLKNKNNKLLKFFSQIFLIGNINKKQKILISGANTEIYSKEGEYYIEYLSPGHMILKRDVFFKDNIWFPNNFFGRSFGEGIYLSYQIFLKYKNGLLYDSKLKVKNIGKKLEKPNDNKSLEKMKIIYRFIFWYNFVYQNKISHFIAYLWSQIGLFLVDIYQRRSIKILKLKLKTYIFLLKNYKKIINDKINYNEYIFKD